MTTNLLALDKATFAGGCFWCVESDFEKLQGITDVVSGYMGGQGKEANYKDVSKGSSGHREVVQITYDATKTSYDDLLNHFWMHVDPTDESGQFADRGFQYTTAIYYHSDAQKKAAQASLQDLEKDGPFKKPVVTKIVPAGEFYPAEEYHQDYAQKNPTHYKRYRIGSGRAGFLEDTWEKGSAWFSRVFKSKENSGDDLKSRLTPLQYQVTQEDGTEPPFDNEYWDNKQEGIYVDIVSGEPLFSSNDKYKSGTGWPSFTRPLVTDNVVLKKDYKLILPRTEVRSKDADSHLGHVFNDGPKDKGGKRYCMNSASLRFVPKEELKEQGYAQFISQFE